MNRFIENYTGKIFDVLVIGGGITGAAVAYDAAARGFSVGLIDKKDFGSGTSSATSKMIHGGVRYLTTFQFALVRESLRERRILGKIAPNFIYPFPMILTAHKKYGVSKWVLKTGLTLYDLLGFDKKWIREKSKQIPNHKTIGKKKARELEPNIKADGLAGAFISYDCRSISPDRLTLAFIKSAIKNGAEVSNYTQAEEFVFSKQNRIESVRVKDIISDKDVEIKVGLTINCGGPWGNSILNLVNSKDRIKQIKRSEGIHIITKKLVNQNAVMSQTPDGRHCFLIPWRGHTLIGTTDKEYTGNPDDYRVTKEAIQELIQIANKSFGTGQMIQYDDVLYAFGGLRPLLESQERSVYKASRKYEIKDLSSEGLEGLISVEGGKYTTSRNVAENTINYVEKKLNKTRTKCITDKVHLAACEITNIEEYITDALKRHHDVKSNTIDYLFRHYGTEYIKILEIAKEDVVLSEPLNEDGEIAAQVVYAIRNEMAMTLEDILLRRTGIGTLGHPGQRTIEKISLIAAKELNWDTKQLEREIINLDRIFEIPR